MQIEVVMTYVEVPFPFRTPGVIAWCKATIGPGHWLGSGDRPDQKSVWSCTVAHHNMGTFMKFAFINESDAMMFSLRWL